MLEEQGSMSGVAQMLASPYSCERGPYADRGGKRASRPDGSLSAPRRRLPPRTVMPGLDPGIHVLQMEGEGVDGRNKPGHAGEGGVRISTWLTN
jgi:hypothetical protein